MAIPKHIIDDIRYEFQLGQDNQTLKLDDNEINAFWEWFGNNGNKYEMSTNPDNGLINKKNISGRCFGNSQTIAISSRKKYCEGFIKTKEGYIFHGFNIDNDKVEDYTVLSNKDNFKDLNNNLPSEYYGVLLSNDIIDKYNRKDLDDGIMNISHLIDKYFKAQKK